MLHSLPLHRFNESIVLPAADIERIQAMGEPPMRLARHAVLRREGEPPRFIYLLIEGWVASSVLLPGGDRQITKFHLPGDLLGTPSMCLERTADTLTALTPASVSRVSLASFGELFQRSPSFAAAMLLSIQRERVALMDRLAAVGRTPALARVSALLLDLAERLGALSGGTIDEFELPVTQEQIGDHLGLTAVHVNRVFRQLVDTGLIRRNRQRVTLLDRQRLRSVSARQEREPAKDVSWLVGGQAGA
ncbi:Crp/Fnr family transcriptional regulator [Sphingomonas sp. BK580]|uniref:Crp/Fnr family transcriptional regulator n=1 Tax=Sphingomonas sp. BK580 TaxID=2586972 RepID=UPI001620635B|nr:Crp/Fnr family transcriptional regulator [Sphingomonas sp. BK580]MBB3694253.1 CRP-like cAMP-binding protein [Sphingomonas sp. BK580]